MTLPLGRHLLAALRPGSPETGRSGAGQPVLAADAALRASAAPRGKVRRPWWRRKRSAVYALLLGVAGVALLEPRAAARLADDAASSLSRLDDKLLEGRVKRDIELRTQAAARAWRVAPDGWTGTSWALQAVWSPRGLLLFDAPPTVILEGDPDQLANLVVDALYATAASGTAAVLGYSGCALLGDAVAPGSGSAMGSLCAPIAVVLTTDFRRQVHRDLFGREIDPTAEMVGAVVGSIGGTAVAVRLAHGSYAQYEAVARGLTEKTMRTHGAAIDPLGLRGPGHHLDHWIPVRCGYMLGIPPALIASAANLQILEAQVNMAFGASGCAG